MQAVINKNVGRGVLTKNLTGEYATFKLDSMRWLSLVSCLVVLSILSGCGGGGGVSPSEDNNPPFLPFNIYGVVKDLVGRAIPNADVSAYYKDDPQQTILDEDKTDEKGRYYLWVPVAKDKVYLITASKAGYQTVSKEIQLSAPDYQGEVNFTLSPTDKR